MDASDDESEEVEMQSSGNESESSVEEPLVVEGPSPHPFHSFFGPDKFRSIQMLANKEMKAKTGVYCFVHRR